MAKCKWCGEAASNLRHGYCENCNQEIRADIVKHKCRLESLAKDASPFLETEEKNRIYQEATDIYQHLYEYKLNRVSFFKSDALQMKNTVLEHLGLPAEAAVADPVLAARSTKNTLIFALVFTAIVLVFVFFLSQKVMELAKLTPEEMLILAAQHEVSNLLKSPSSAKFPLMRDSNYTIHQDYSKEDVYLVTSYVDSENSFGAVIRSRFFATIQFDFDTETYRVLNIEIT